MNASSDVAADQCINIDFLYTKIHNAMSKFDKIFGNIVTICKDVHDQRIDSDVLVDGSVFTIDQSEAIVQFSGYLSSIFDHIQLVRINAIHKESVLKDIPVSFHHDQHLAMEETVAKMQKKISLLQDMLVQEMNKAEELETSLRSSEAELLAVTEEKGELKKKIEKLLRKVSDEKVHVNLRSVSHKPSTNDKAQICNIAIENPESFIGRYIRKQFDNRKYFGIISSYSSPFFLVIYEDGDREELDSREITELLWEGIIPTTNRNAVARHEKLYLDSMGIKPLQLSSSSQSVTQSNLTAATDHLSTSSMSSLLSITKIPSLSQQSQSHDTSDRQIALSSPTETIKTKSKIRSVSPLVPEIGIKRSRTSDIIGEKTRGSAKKMKEIVIDLSQD